MSLRSRLLVAIILALLLSFGFGAGAATWQAARAVRIELTAALDSAYASAAAALAGAASAGGQVDEGELRRIVAAFDGNRHVRAELTESGRGIHIASSLARAGAQPGWFLATVQPVIPPVALEAGTARLVLTPDAANESFERWSELRQALLLLAFSALVSGILASVTAARALAPLTKLSEGLARLGQGRSGVRLDVAGPPEIAALATSFNTLSQTLQTTREQNQRLHRQAAVIAEEERAEIARDLHDEVGPLLFAITAYTATIGTLVAERDLAGIPPHLAAIQEAASAIQLQVRDMLGRLNDVSPQPACLASALDGLVGFWRGVQTDIDFRVDTAMEEAALTSDLRETLFRIAQEGISNAVRHARPRRVSVQVVQDGRTVSLAVADDGAGGPEGPGYGLAGMRARAAASGGALRIERARGWTVTATLPLPAP